MCPVLCDPPRNYPEVEVLPRRRAKHAVGLLFCVLVAATPALFRLYPSSVDDVIYGAWTSRPVMAVRETFRPVTRLLTGDTDQVRSWVNHQKTTRLMLFASLGVCLGMYLMLRE